MCYKIIKINYKIHQKACIKKNTKELTLLIMRLKILKNHLHLIDTNMSDVLSLETKSDHKKLEENLITSRSAVKGRIIMLQIDDL